MLSTSKYEEDQAALFEEDEGASESYADDQEEIAFDADDDHSKENGLPLNIL